MYRLTIIFILIISSLNISGQDLGEVVCPLPGDTMINGQLLIVFRLNPDLHIKPSSLDVVIDRVSYKYLMKTNGSKLTVLVTTPIKKGRKTIRITAKDESGEKIEESWAFFISGDKKREKDVKQTKVNAFLETSSRFSDVSGEGAALRQEPPVTHQLKFRGNIQHGNIEIPIKLYVTNHEKSYLPPRDRFFIGVKTKKAGVYFGDVNPFYHRLMLNGTRVRGAEAFFQIRSFQLRLLYGTVNRPVEGLRLYYNSLQDPSFPPVNLQDIRYDSTFYDGYYNDNGTYRRNIMAARFTLGSPNTNNKIHFVFLKSTDDTNSINYGGQASENLSFGIDLETKSKNKRLKINAGAAAAFTTRDIRYGVATEETINALYGIKMPVDPYKFRNLLVINTTTTIPSIKHTPFLSYYIKPEYHIANQRITAEARWIGADFQSFGNPYLINDRFIVSLTDRMRFFKDRLFLQVRLRHYNNNLSRSDTVTSNTDMIDASFNYLIKQGLPRLNGGVRKYFRSGMHTGTEERYPEYQISNYYAGIISIFNLWEINSSLTLNYNLNERDYLQRERSVVSHSVFVNLNQDYNFGLTLNLQYNFMLLTNDTSNFSENNTYGIRLGYRTKNNKLRFSVGAMRLRSVETVWLPESERSSLNANIDYKLNKSFSIKIEAGNLQYNELDGID
ncbi:MAG: hypothetical protein DRJ05_12370, partial [Bacteroidetes bacterium]